MAAPASWRSLRARLTLRLRTIQVYPNDLRVLPGHPAPAVSWHSGFRGGAHARPKTTPVHHAARRRGGGVAARGAGAAVGEDPARRIHPSWNSGERVEPTTGLLGFDYRILEVPGSEDFESNFAMMRQWSVQNNRHQRRDHHL